MELTLQRSELQRELQLCQGVVEKRSTIPILSNVLLRANGDRLEIAATDLDVTIQTSCPAIVTTEGGMTVEARRIFDIIRSLPDDEVKLTLQENESLLVESGTAKFRLLGLPADDYPSLPKVDRKSSFEVPLGDLTSMVEKVIFAITHEETRFQLNGALLKIYRDKMEMVATDGYRMALVNTPREFEGIKKNDAVTMLIPRKALQEILKMEPLGDDPSLHFGVSENHLYFETGHRTLMARMIDVNFPNYMEVIAKDNDKRVVVDRDRLHSTIRRVSLVANERTRAVRLDFAAGKLTVSSTNAELGDARESVPIEYSGDPFYVGLNGTYLADFLNVVDCANVTLDLKDESSQCIARPMDEDETPFDYLYVVMPMRIS